MLKLNPADQVATATALTAESMARAYRNFVLPLGTLDEVLLSGGGRLNSPLRKAFSRALPTVWIRTLEDTGYDSNSSEVVAFAIFAYATLHGLRANVPSATGAHTAVVIGKIVPGRNYRQTRLD